MVPGHRTCSTGTCAPLWRPGCFWPLTHLLPLLCLTHSPREWDTDVLQPISGCCFQSTEQHRPMRRDIVINLPVCITGGAYVLKSNGFNQTDICSPAAPPHSYAPLQSLKASGLDRLRSTVPYPAQSSLQRWKMARLLLTLPQLHCSRGPRAHCLQ